MAINFTDFSKIPTQEPWYGHALEDVLKGYQIGQVPQKMADEKKQRQLANALQEKALAHKDMENSLNDRLKQSQIDRANRPAALKGALADAFRLRDQFPEGSQERNQVNNYINKLGTSAGGIQVTSSPEGGFQVSIGGQGESASLPGLPKLKIGETYLYNQDKQPIGIGKPYSEGEKKEESGRLFFNEAQNFINKSQGIYSGKGSTKKFESDLINYATDEAAQERINNFLASEKLLFSSAVKENATLGGANTNKVYDRLLKSLQSSEVYPLLKDIAKYQLPEGYAVDVGDIFQQKLNDATEKAKNMPAYKVSYFNTNANKERDLKLSKKLDKKIFKSAAEMKAYYKSLSPEEKIAFKRQQLGGQ